MTFSVVVFVQLVNTISGGFQAGNAHLQDRILVQNGLASQGKRRLTNAAVGKNY
ncbi:hypothetical protein [Mesorhizobium amorphae]|uniref:hypothetical protein n=1 Tax=Mesorhizobium amorphae TaxID=71433 RepID=UPI00178604E8|nr:hypothetical protein [Mesorhizobium amorphae]